MIPALITLGWFLAGCFTFRQLFLHGDFERDTLWDDNYSGPPDGLVLIMAGVFWPLTAICAAFYDLAHVLTLPPRQKDQAEIKDLR